MKRILVADDKDTSREPIRLALGNRLYAITEASDGIEALRRAHEVLPDLIILDLHMPGVDASAFWRSFAAT
jgi:CheY-like chemotaxis protein